ncbi:MAG: bifunctional nuclease family protein [Candidatus Gastranaerophilales bacterium]|nr:bifunctional nuclease family protein [Candidatus Gastranaerophilales bacterium]
MIEMHIMGIAIDTRTGAPIIILNDKERRRALPIWIGQAEASAIIRIMEGMETPRPMTHDLICKILEINECTLEKIEINDLNDNTYYATIFMKDAGGKTHEIDARPSDALALAMKIHTPVFVTPNVVLDGTISMDLERDEKETEEFKNFIKDIKPSDFQKLINEKRNFNEMRDDEN